MQITVIRNVTLCSLVDSTMKIAAEHPPITPINILAVKLHKAVIKDK
jgi:hypothetical protein